MSSTAARPQAPFRYNSLGDEEAPQEVGSPQSTSDDEEVSPAAPRPWRHVAVAATGGVAALLLLALSLCTLVPLHGSTGPAAFLPAREPSPAISAAKPHVATMTPRQLLDSDRFADVAADNAMAIAQDSVHPQLRPEIRDGFRAGFRNISARLWASHPEAGTQLDEIQLTPAEQAAFLKMMRSVSNPRVLHMGRNVGLQVHHGVGEARRSQSGGSDAKRHVADSLGSDLVSIRQLREEVIPEEIRGPEDLSGGVDDISLSVGRGGVSFMRTLDHWNLELDVAAPRVDAVDELPPSERRLSSSSGNRLSAESMIELMKMEAQVEKYLNQMQELAATKYNIHIPNMQESLRGVDMTDAVQCAMSAAISADVTTFLKCGMEFWELAMDVMQNIAHSFGPVTTTTEQVVFRSFDDMMD